MNKACEECGEKSAILIFWFPTAQFLCLKHHTIKLKEFAKAQKLKQEAS